MTKEKCAEIREFASGVFSKDFIEEVKKNINNETFLQSDQVDALSAVEVRSLGLHIMLVPLTEKEQQKKRVNGYRYLTV